jgi:hypothetical protein
MAQAIKQYCGFNKNVELDMKAKFELEDIKTQQLFAFLYEKPKKKYFFLIFCGLLFEFKKLLFLDFRHL